MHQSIQGVKARLGSSAGNLSSCVISAASGLPVGHCLVINCNRASVLQNEPFDSVLLLRLPDDTRLLIIACDCHAAQSGRSRQPSTKPVDLIKKVRTMTEGFTAAGFDSPLVMSIIASTTELSPLASEIAADHLQLKLGLRQLQGMMPPWSPWVYRKGRSFLEAATGQ